MSISFTTPTTPIYQMTNFILEANTLTKTIFDGGEYYNIFANINISLALGEAMAIVGSSGCGKTSLLSCIGLVDTITSGILKINNINVTHLSDNERSVFRMHNIGFIYQAHHPLGEFNVTENVMMPLLIQGYSEENAERTAINILQQLELSKQLRYMPHQLSGGQKQRVAIARGIVGNKKLILADEPTGNLDTKLTNSFVDLMLDIASNYQCSIVFVTHNVSIANRIGNIFHLEGMQDE